MDQRELLWRQYSQSVDLFKFYMDLVIKLNAFYYAISGAIFSFYFANSTIPNIKYSLVLPVLMSTGLIIFFIYGSKLMLVLRKYVFDLSSNLDLDVAPDLGVLIAFMCIFATVFFAVAAGA